MTKLLDEIPQHLQDDLLEMAPTHSVREIKEWLATKEIDIHRSTVGYWIRSKGIHKRDTIWIKPAKTHKEKMRQYLTALIEYEHPTFTIKNLDMRGANWNYCSITLVKSGAIEKMRRYSPMRYRILATKDELKELCR